ncbi:MAG: DUF6687 family protein [Acidimicrobiales bacterium]
MALRYVPYAETHDRPNVVVDGAPNAASVLSLSHWPGLAQPPGIGADLSAQMVFRHLDGPGPAAAGAEVVTCDHFDQDGLVSVFALVDPQRAVAHRSLLIDVAAAGDFATYRHRAAARASMALWTYGHAEQSPLAAELAALDDAADRDALLFTTLLPLLVELVTTPEGHRHLWAEEDERLAASERAIATGAAIIDERPDLDLVIVTVPGDGVDRSGHRFGTGAMELRPIHPMAINNASGRFRQLFVDDRCYRYVDRYETWVQYRSRRPLPRVDLRPLAEALTAVEPRRGRWHADGPGSLTPALWSEDSALDPPIVIGAIAAHLETAPPAWNPYLVP